MVGRGVLSARGVGWRVGSAEILAPLDVDLAAGECLAVVGPNGAGKTTLLRLLGGLVAPSEGEVQLGSEPFSTLSRRVLARHIAYVPQVRSANIALTVEQMVTLGRFPHLSTWQMRPTAEDLARVDYALKTVGLESLRERPMNELSGGERQSVFIAAALAQEAEILLLDEPTTHLDARHQLEVTHLLQELRRSGEHAIVLTTHDLNLALRLADRVLALKEGQVVATGDPESLLDPGKLEQIFDAPFAVLREERAASVLLRLDR
jgi:iron complex transport system ATP-binding protein